MLVIFSRKLEIYHKPIAETWASPDSPNPFITIDVSTWAYSKIIQDNRYILEISTKHITETIGICYERHWPKISEGTIFLRQTCFGYAAVSPPIDPADQHRHVDKKMRWKIDLHLGPTKTSKLWLAERNCEAFTCWRWHLQDTIA